MYDVFFLSYDEPMAASHWNMLKRNVPTARSVTGIDGIHSAHLECAKLCKTSHFFVIDADNEVLSYDFTFKIPRWDSDYAHLWYARNPLNGLEYGWGGIKLFPKRSVLNMSSGSLDMTTSFSLKVVPEIKSRTHFNYAPLETWRSAFRECVKLSISSDPDAATRLETWKTVAEGPYSKECLEGAEAGSQYACANRDNPDAIRKINDFKWLSTQFEDRKR
jgi:hypothetical protein